MPSLGGNNVFCRIKIVQILYDVPPLQLVSLFLFLLLDVGKKVQKTCTFLMVSEMATAIHVGHTAKAIKFAKATKGAEQTARVTPAKVRMRPCNQVVSKDF